MPPGLNIPTFTGAYPKVSGFYWVNATKGKNLAKIYVKGFFLISNVTR